MVKSLDDLPPEEAYVVTRLRETGEMLRLDPNSRPLLCVAGAPVSTFDTLFRMLGRGVVAHDPSAQRQDRWHLTEEWK